MLYYTVLGFLIVVGIGVIAGLASTKKKKYVTVTVKPSGTVPKMESTAPGVEPLLKFPSVKTVFGEHPNLHKAAVHKYTPALDSSIFPIPANDIYKHSKVHKIEHNKEIKCPICDWYKERGIEKPKTLSEQAVEAIKNEVIKKEEEINRGIYMKTSSGHQIILRDLPPKDEYPKCETDESRTKRWYNKEGKFHREDGPAIEYYNGLKCWYLDGKCYSEENWKQELINRRWKTPPDDQVCRPVRPSDKPITDKNGNQKWFNKDGQWHREDGPAVIYTNGTKLWYKNGKPHREDGPAKEYADGRKQWWLNGQHYAEKQWKQILNKEEPGRYYYEVRKNPVVQPNGDKHWFNKQGELHREDGPAIVWTNGTKYWFLNNTLMTEQQWEKEVQKLARS